MNQRGSHDPTGNPCAQHGVFGRPVFPGGKMPPATAGETPTATKERWATLVGHAGAN